MNIIRLCTLALLILLPYQASAAWQSWFTGKNIALSAACAAGCYVAYRLYQNYWATPKAPAFKLAQPVDTNATISVNMVKNTPYLSDIGALKEAVKTQQEMLNKLQNQVESATRYVGNLETRIHHLANTRELLPPTLEDQIRYTAMEKSLCAIREIMSQDTIYLNSDDESDTESVTPQSCAFASATGSPNLSPLSPRNNLADSL
jgi:hypothetical protein